MLIDKEQDPTRSEQNAITISTKKVTLSAATTEISETLPIRTQYSISQFSKAAGMLDQKHHLTVSPVHDK